MLAAASSRFGLRPCEPIGKVGEKTVSFSRLFIKYSPNVLCACGVAPQYRSSPDLGGNEIAEDKCLPLATREGSKQPAHQCDATEKRCNTG